MKSRFFPVLIMALVTVSTEVSFANCILQFEAFAGTDGVSVEVIGRGKVVLRLRGDSAAALLPRAQLVAEKLNAAAIAGARPADVAVRASNQHAQLLVSGQAVVNVDAALARSSNSSAEGLARNWAANLKSVLAEPYLTLAPYPELLVPVGESRALRWGGTAGGPHMVQVADDSVATVESLPDGRGLTVWALQPGDTELAIGVRDCRGMLSVVCRQWAARIPPTSQLQVSGGGLRSENLMQAVESLVYSATSLEPGAQLSVGTPAPANGGYLVNVKAEGAHYLPVVRKHTVQIQRISAPPMHPEMLLVSNVPEKVTQPAVLLREFIEQRQGARLLWHHVNVSARPLRLVVRLHNTGDTAMPVHLTEGHAGPSTDELFAGHVAAARFMSDLFTGSGYVLAIPAQSSIELAEVRLRPHELASGIKRMVPMADGGLIVEVMAGEDRDRRHFLSPVPQSLYGTSMPSGFVYGGEKVADLEHTVGEGWAFCSIGRGTDMSTAGRPLMGSYGVLFRVDATVTNPTERPATVELAMHPRGGVARGVFWIEGQLVETPMLDNRSEMVIHQATVLPGGTHKVRLFTIPQSGSHYPVLLTLRSRPR